MISHTRTVTIQLRTYNVNKEMMSDELHQLLADLIGKNVIHEVWDRMGLLMWRLVPQGKEEHNPWDPELD